MWLGVAFALANPEITPPVTPRLELTAVGRGVNVTQTLRARLEAVLTRTQAFYEHGLGVRHPARIPLTISVWGQPSEFDAVKRELGAPAWAVGFFAVRAGVPEAHVSGQGDTERMLAGFRHEASHWLLGYASPTPRWLDEGLAQCFEHAVIRGNLMTVHPPDRVIQQLARSGAVSVEALVRAPSSWIELPSDQAGPLYAHGLALTAFLLSSPAGQDAIREVLRAHRAKPGSQTVLDVLDARWNGGLPGLQRDFDRWLVRPPRAIPIPGYLAGASKPVPGPPASDGVWTRCPDGGLVAASIGCAGR